MMKRLWSWLFMVTLGVASSHLALAEPGPLSKHPRVAELEEKLSKDASNYLRGRFPELPFLATVSVDPLRRVEGNTYSQSGRVTERLPFMEFETEEIQDEWDDPEVPLLRLLNRTRKVSVQISLPDTLNDYETQEVKEFILSALHLIQARDEVVVVRRKWENTTGTPWWIYASVATGIVTLFLMGLLLINRGATQKLATAIAESKSGASSGGAMGSVSPVSSMSGSSGADSKMGGDMRVSDPIKMQELTMTVVRDLTSATDFPNLLDMVTLDQLARKDPGALGAILTEFSVKDRQRLFALSTGSKWLEGIAHPGIIDLQTFELLREMTRNPRGGRSAAWEQLLVYVWRLGDDAVKFMREVPQDAAFAILSSLPRSVAVSVARRSFPGAWAAILNPDFKPTFPEDDIVDLLKDKALQMKPLNDFKQIDRYRQDEDLLSYLSRVDLTEEREIYGAAREDSLIHKLRPPFYRVFEGSRELLSELVVKFNSEQWAIALLSVSSADRGKLSELMSEKQKFMFEESLARYERSAPDTTVSGRLREKIARTFSELENAASVAPVIPLKQVTPPPLTNKDQKNAA